LKKGTGTTVFSLREYRFNTNRNFVHLGLAMTEADRQNIVAKARGVNPNIAIFQVTRNANRDLAFKHF
jgi:hypothetical protein